MKVVEVFESRPHNAVSFVVERGKEVQEWNEQKLPGALPDYSGGRLPGRSTKEKGREEGEADEDGGEKRIRSQIAVAGIKEKVSVHDGIKNAVQRPVGHRNEEEEEESWREGDQMAAQWDEEQKLDDMQKVPEPEMHERMSQGKGVKDLKEKKKVAGSVH